MEKKPAKTQLLLLLRESGCIWRYRTSADSTVPSTYNTYLFVHLYYNTIYMNTLLYIYIYVFTPRAYMRCMRDQIKNDSAPKSFGERDEINYYLYLNCYSAHNRAWWHIIYCIAVYDTLFFAEFCAQKLYNVFILYYYNIIIDTVSWMK